MQARAARLPVLLAGIAYAGVAIGVAFGVPAASRVGFGNLYLPELRPSSRTGVARRARGTGP